MRAITRAGHYRSKPHGRQEILTASPTLAVTSHDVAGTIAMTVTAAPEVVPASQMVRCIERKQARSARDSSAGVEFFASSPIACRSDAAHIDAALDPP